ncbi:hypothetical protein KAM260_04740 [Klebsiella pneumoniae]|nr:hypothetical protein KAM260_04740 [Klebsiella pneumoniae]
MTDTVIKPEEISDALFSCVYSWVNGHAIDKKGADAAVARHRDSTSPYGVLARRGFVGLSWAAMLTPQFSK